MKREQEKYISRKLKELEKETDLSLNQLRVLLALERIAVRLLLDPTLNKHLVFKGGFVMARVYESSRFTRDLDALGQSISYESIKSLVPLSINADLNDGLWFGDIKIKDLEHQGEYQGIRFDLAFQIGPPKTNKIHKLSRVHFDIGIGDKVPNSIKPAPLKSLLDSREHIAWRVYPPEYIYSEKLETLVKRDSANSRAKDIFDLSILFKKCDPEKLKTAINDTFGMRKTAIPASFEAFLHKLDLYFIERSWNQVEYGNFKEIVEVLTADFSTLDELL